MYPAEITLAFSACFALMKFSLFIICLFTSADKGKKLATLNILDVILWITVQTHRLCFSTGGLHDNVHK